MNFRYITKSAKVVAIAAMMLSGQACNNLLDEVVVSGIDNAYLNTPKDLKMALTQHTRHYGYITQPQLGLTMTEFGTDIYATGADVGIKVSIFMIHK